MTNEFTPVSELFKQLPVEREKRIRAEAAQVSAEITSFNSRGRADTMPALHIVK